MKVIFIASAPVSGSTILNLMLGNGTDCFGAGEIAVLMRQDDPIICTCGKNENCPIWKGMDHYREEYVYKILGKNLGVEIISDSSKIWEWIVYQRWRQKDTQVVMLYKHPLNYLYSWYKRGQGADWIWRWILYYENALKDFSNPHVIPYRDLAQSPGKTLKKICNAVGVNYFNGKELYWNSKVEYHALFGSRSARLHLQNKRFLRRYKRGGGDRRDEIKHYKTIYYSERWRKELPESFRDIPNRAWELYDRLEGLC